MDTIYDQVRQRTNELRRVAADARRERDLRAVTVEAATATRPVPALAHGSRPAHDPNHSCPTAGQPA